MWPDCKARRVNDEYHCVRCALRWDVSDEEPPVCRPMSSENAIDATAQRSVERWQKQYGRKSKRYG